MQSHEIEELDKTDERRQAFEMGRVAGEQRLRKHEEHNGFANVQTWMISMFLDGNYTGQGTYASALEVIAKEIEGEDEPLKTNLGGVMDRLRSFVEVEAFTDDDDGSTIRRDMLKASLDAVNWRELAIVHIENVQEIQGAGEDI